MTINWQPGASLETLRARADLLAGIRGFFQSRGVLEVDTPQLARSTASDPHLQSLSVTVMVPGEGHIPCYLQTSPEFAMKRLLAAGSGPIYQICHAFRDGELGARHNPEFTMLEWYRPGMVLENLMAEVADLVAMVLEISPELPRYAYRDLFMDHLSIDPLSCPVEALVSILEGCGLDRVERPADAEDMRPFCLDLLFSHAIEPGLGRDRPVFVYDFPPEQAALARIYALPDGSRAAQRFELFYRGVELANGYQELTDRVAHKFRFKADAAARRRQGLPEIPLDERFCAAVAAGLPDCAGVALGIDRLLMLSLHQSRIERVMAFDVTRVL